MMLNMSMKYSSPWVCIILGMGMGGIGWHCPKNQGVRGNCLRQHWCKAANLVLILKTTVARKMLTMEMTGKNNGGRLSTMMKCFGQDKIFTSYVLPSGTMRCLNPSI